MSEDLADLFSGAAPPGAYRWHSRASAGSIAAAATAGGWTFFHLDGRKVASKADFLAACARAMDFPDYFGYNWDALEDSLRDLSWAPAQAGYLLLYDAAGVFAAAAPDDFAVALDILRSAVAFWRFTATPMVALLRGLGPHAAGLPNLGRDAGQRLRTQPRDP